MTVAGAVAWEEAFLKALAATGIAKAAAGAAGIGVRAAYRRKQDHPTFAAAWATAAELHRSEAARRAISSAQQLVVDRHDGGKAVRAGQSRWSKRGEEAFLTELSVTANVLRAAAAAGFTASGLYGRRRKDPAFAEAWDAAVAAGRARLELFLIEAADRTFDPECIGDDADIPRITIAEVIKTLQLAQGKCGRPAAKAAEDQWSEERNWRTPEDAAEVTRLREGILEKLERIRQREDREKLAKGWARHGEDWVPPGFGPIVDCKALPAVEVAVEEEPLGPSVRTL
jgi:hypothetical protein